MLPRCWTREWLVLQQESGAWHRLQDPDPDLNHLQTNYRLAVDTWMLPCQEAVKEAKNCTVHNSSCACCMSRLDNNDNTTCRKRSQLQHLRGYLGHVVEGAKSDEAIEQCWQWSHLWSICTPAHALALVAELTSTKSTMTAGKAMTRCRPTSPLYIAKMVCMHGRSLLL